MIGVDAHYQPGALKLSGLCLRLKIAAVEQHGPIAQAIVLVGVPVAEDHEGVMLVAGSAPDAAGALNAGAQGGAAGTALHDVSAVEGNHIQIRALEIQAQGGAPAQADGLLPLVPHQDGPRDEIVFLQHAIKQLCLHLGGIVPQDYAEGFPLLRSAKKGGQSLQGILAPPYPAAHIPQVRRMAPAGQLKLDGGQAEVPHAAGGILLWRRIQGEGPVRSRLVRIGGEPPVRVPEQSGEIAAVTEPGAVVDVLHHAGGMDRQLIGGMLRMQGECPALFVVSNHRRSPQKN